MYKKEASIFLIIISFLIYSSTECTTSSSPIHNDNINQLSNINTSYNNVINVFFDEIILNNKQYKLKNLCSERVKEDIEKLFKVNNQYFRKNILKYGKEPYYKYLNEKLIIELPFITTNNINNTLTIQLEIEKKNGESIITSYKMNSHSKYFLYSDLNEQEKELIDAITMKINNQNLDLKKFSIDKADHKTINDLIELNRSLLENSYNILKIDIYRFKIQNNKLYIQIFLSPEKDDFIEFISQKFKNKYKIVDYRTYD